MGEQRIVLPGGAGLVGQNLVVRLKERGSRNLAVIDKHRANLAILAQLHPEVEAVEADLAVPGPWQDLVSRADVVVLLQAQIGGEERAAFEHNNVEATRRILEALRRDSPPYLVHVSSSVVASVVDDLYSETKRAQEQLVLDSGIPCPVLRPTLMYGWFDRKHLGWLSRFMRRVPVFPIPGDGKYMRQPLYVGDFCNIIIGCIDKRTPGGIFNISGLERIDYIDMIREIKAVTGASCLILPIPYRLFHLLLAVWGTFDRNPPFTTQQLEALCADDEFEVIDWPGIFGVDYTPFREAIAETFTHPAYGDVVLEF